MKNSYPGIRGGDNIILIPPIRRRGYTYCTPTRAIAYTHFISWLALNGTPGDLAVAAAVNLPVWGANCSKLAMYAESVGVKSTRFMEMFSGPYDELESLAEDIAHTVLRAPILGGYSLV